MNSHTNQTEGYLSSKDAGEILGYTHDYVSRLCRQGHMVGKKVGREWFVRPSDLEIFKKKHEVVLQKKKKQLSQKLSQIRKEHEAQKRAQKQVVQKIDNSPIHPATQSVSEYSESSGPKSFNPISKLIIPKQLVAVCVLALVLLIPTIVDVISSTPIAPAQSQKQTANISQITPIFYDFGSSVATLPNATFDIFAEVGMIYLAIYELQGQLVFEAMSQTSSAGSVVLFGWELIGASFVHGYQNVINAYAGMFGHMYQDSLGQTHAYVTNVTGGYQYVAYTFYNTLISLCDTAKQTSLFVVDNISENITEMNKTIASMSYQLSASIGTFVDTKNQKNSSSEVIFVK